MRRRVQKTIDAEVLALWRARFAMLGEKLAQSPSSESAWFWRIQWDILNYLLHRYGGDKKQAEPGIVTASAVGAVAAAENSAVLENTPSGAFTAYAGLGKMPRASGQIRPILEKIVQGNQERYELLSRLRKEMLEAARSLSNQVQEWPDWAKAYLSELEFLKEAEKAEKQQLTDDEIVEMLSKMMEMEERGEIPPVKEEEPSEPEKS
jgi:hypothetical protein